MGSRRCMGNVVRTACAVTTPIRFPATDFGIDPDVACQFAEPFWSLESSQRGKSGALAQAREMPMSLSVPYVLGGTLTEQQRLLTQARGLETYTQSMLDQIPVKLGDRAV